MTVRDETTAGSAGSTEQAREKAQELAGQAKGRVATEVDTRSTQAGQQLQTAAGDVRSVGEELRKQGKDKPAELAERAAGQVERIGGYLQDSDGDRILRDVEDFGRRQPWAVMFGGLAAGFLASRFLKASSSRRAAERFESAGGLPPRKAVTPPPAPMTVPPASVSVPPGSAVTR